MFANADTLAWEALSLQEPEIPWDKLRAFAGAAVESADVRRRLMEELNGLLDRREAGDDSAFENFTDVAVPAVIALAAKQFDEAGRRDMAKFTIEMMYRAGKADNDACLEASERAAGSLGPAVIEPALAFLNNDEKAHHCWFHVSNLLRVAKEGDEVTKRSVAEHCREYLRGVLSGDEDVPEAYFPVSVLAALNDTESLPLLRSMKEHEFLPGDIDEVIAKLEGRNDEYDSPNSEPWNEPVEEWLPDEVEWMREALDEWKNRGEEGEVDEHPPLPVEELHKSLINEFTESEAFAALPERPKEHAGFVLGCFANYAWTHLGTRIEYLTSADVSEILLELFPQKVSAEREVFHVIPQIVATFLDWLGVTGRIDNATVLSDEARACAVGLLRNSQDRRNWGMAKSFSMAAMEAGIDPTDRVAMKEFTAAYNLAHVVHRNVPSASETTPKDDWAPSAPIRAAAKVGRNEPCPCGSGKKYKKCCGKT